MGGSSPIWIDFTLKDPVRRDIRNWVDALLAGEGDKYIIWVISRLDVLKKYRFS